MEAAGKNISEERGSRGLRNQLQSGAILHDHPEFRVSAAVRGDGHKHQRLAWRFDFGERISRDQPKYHHQQFCRRPELSPRLRTSVESEYSARSEEWRGDQYWL